jgi:hypothetical protein
MSYAATLSRAIPGIVAVALAGFVLAPPAAAASGGSVPIATLAAVGTRTDVVVAHLRTPAQARWVDHVVDQNLTSTQGCLADPSARSLHAGTYRAHVNLLCAGGARQARAAAAALVAARPWYRLRTSSVAVTAFTFVAALDHGNGDAVPAGLAQLPSTDFTIADGDDVSLTYVGQGVTQSRLDAALAAFAGALHIPVAQVKVSPITWN